MALSPADFYAYSRATGTPYPEDAEERARVAPDVLDFRRNQLKAPSREEDQGFNLTNALGVGAALAGVAGGAYGLHRALAPKIRELQVSRAEPLQKATVERAQQAAQTDDLGKVGSLVRDLTPKPSAEPPAPVNRRQPLEGQFSSVPRRQPGSFAELSDIENQINAEIKLDEFLNDMREEQRQIDAENKFQTRIVQGMEGKDKAGAKNILAEFRREEQETQQFTPRSYIEETGAVAPIEDLTTLQDAEIVDIADQQVNAVESGEDQFTGRQLRDIQRDTDTVKTSSSASVALPVIFNSERQISPQVQEAEALTGRQATTTQAPSVLSKIRKRRADSREERAEAYRLLRESLMDTGDAIDVTELDPSRVGSLSAELLQKAKQRTQRSTPAPITQQYKDALFDADPSNPNILGLLKPEIIARNLGDTNVFPEELQQKLVAAMKPFARKTGSMETLELDPSVHREATNHVIKNLLAEDNADSVKDYLLGSGEYISPRTKGFGYTGTESEKTQIFTIANDKGNTEVKVSRPTSAARRTRSDLEPLFFDPDTGALLSKSDLGATQSAEGDVGSGIGQEIGQAVAFVPRKDVAPFVSLPGVSASGPEDVNKNQGTDYAIGGVKEFGTGEKPSKKSDTGKKYSGDLSVSTLELFNAANDAVEAGKVKISQNGNVYVQVNSLMRQANPALDYDEGVSKYGTLFKNPLTGRNFTSAHEATGVYNQLANAVNKRLIAPAEANVLKIENTENMRLLVNSPTNKSAYMNLNPNLVIDQVTRRTPSGETVTSEVTLSQALRNVLLSPAVTDEKGSVVRDPRTGAPLRGLSLIQEHRVINDDGTPGALFYKQSRYKVPEDFTYVDKETQETRYKMLGLNDTSLPLAGLEEEGSKNNYLFLEGVNNALEKLTGRRVKIIDDALKIGALPDFHFYGGASKNPVLRQALTVANTLVQTSEPSRVRMRNADEGLGERYGLGATVSGPAQRTIPLAGRGGKETVLPSQQVKQQRFTDPTTGEVSVQSVLGAGSDVVRTISPEVAGAKRLSAALLDYRQRSGNPMKKQDVLDFASAIAQQEGADLNGLLLETANISKGRVQQTNISKQMTQGRRALSAMDVISPAEEVAQTVAAYDFNETIGSDIENAIQGARLPNSPLTTEQLERAKVEPPGINQEAVGNLMAQLMAQSKRRAGKRSNR